MRIIRFEHNLLLTLSFISLILAGCAGSPSSKFYQLSSVNNRTLVNCNNSLEQKMTVTIGPVQIPDYLDRPQIVTRSGKNELELSEFDRWAGSLERDVNTVLVEDISSILPVERFSVVRWIPYLESQLSASYRVQVLVDRFEGTIGDSVQLTAHWSVFSGSGSLLLRKESMIIGHMQGRSYAALVTAMSDALAKLSDDIAGGITSVVTPGPTRKNLSKEDSSR